MNPHIQNDRSSTYYRCLGTGITVSFLAVAAIGIFYVNATNELDFCIASSSIATTDLMILYLLYRKYSKALHHDENSTSVNQITHQAKTVTHGKEEHQNLPPANINIVQPQTVSANVALPLSISLNSGNPDEALATIYRHAPSGTFYNELLKIIYEHKDDMSCCPFIERAFALHANHLFRIMRRASWKSQITEDQAFRIMIGQLLSERPNAMQKIWVVDTLYFDVPISSIPKKHLCIEIINRRDKQNRREIESTHLNSVRRRKLVDDLSQQAYDTLICNRLAQFSDSPGLEGAIEEDIYHSEKFLRLFQNPELDIKEQQILVNQLSQSAYNRFIGDICTKFRRDQFSIPKEVFDRKKFLEFIKECPDKLDYELLLKFIPFFEFASEKTMNQKIIQEQAVLFNALIRLRPDGVPAEYHFPAQWANYYENNKPLLRPLEARGAIFRAASRVQKEEAIARVMGVPNDCRDAFLCAYRKVKAAKK